MLGEPHDIMKEEIERGNRFIRGEIGSEWKQIAFLQISLFFSASLLITSLIAQESGSQPRFLGPVLLEPFCALAEDLSIHAVAMYVFAHRNTTLRDNLVLERSRRSARGGRCRR